MKIAITAESTVDLTKELLKEFDIHTVPFTITMGEETALDGEVSSETLFDYVESSKKLPRTSAVNQFQYEEFFKQLKKEYDFIIHFTLSSELSSAYRNALLASEGDDSIAIIDSRSLSTGIALLAIAARRLASGGVEFKDIVEAIKKRIPFVQASFSLESVDYLYKGGRCSMLQMLGVNLLKIKPEITLRDGKMVSGRKYRGPMMKAVEGYVEGILGEFANPDLETVFITYSSAPDDVVESVKKRLIERGFKNIYVTRAGATIATHCGPHCLGILYINDGGLN